MDRPSIRYARHEGAHIAYQALGQGPPSLVFMPDWFTNVEIQWDEPAFARTLERLASFGRLVLFDKRGVGLSDPVVLDALPDLGSWSDDLLAVLDELGAPRAAVIAAGGAGFLALAFAARHPERASHLVLLGASARLLRAADYPAGLPEDLAAIGIPYLLRIWGTGQVLRMAAPDRKTEKPLLDWFARMERVSASPGVVAVTQAMLLELDLRHLLGEVSAPTLVVHRAEDRITPLAHARYLAERIPGARLRVLPGSSHLCFGESPSEWIEEVRQFLSPDPLAPEPVRVVTTVLLTDIIDSTARAEALGDERWQEVKDRHQLLVRREVRSWGGTVLDTAMVGDGHMSRFDRPDRALHCALRLAEGVRELGIEIRAGLHAGEVEVSGSEISGVAVHIGARVCARAGPSQVLVSRTVVDLVRGSGMRFEPVGSVKMKGISGRWQLFELRRELRGQPRAP